jgi:hydroxyacylglutathione hydrolase
MVKIYPLKLSVSNCFLVKGEGNMLVDIGLPGEEGRIIRFLQQHKLQLNDLSLILHTHGHSDHCGSTSALIQQANIPTAIHHADEDLVLSGTNGEIKTTKFFARLIKPFVDKPYPGFKPDYLIKGNNFDLEKFGIKGKVMETPGHTAGSVSLLFNYGVAIIGDLLMGGFLGGMIFPEKPDYHYFASDLNQVNESLRQIMTEPVSTFFVGHGGPLSRENIEKRFRKMLLHA